METLVASMILRSAKLLGLDPASPVVAEAIATGVEGVRSGYDLDTSVEYGRAILVRAAQPSESRVA